MRSTARRALAALLTTAAIAAAGLLAAPATPARATAWNDYWLYMHFPAQPADGRCFWRFIDLSAGTYNWRIFSAHWAHTAQTRWHQRRIYLARGNYQWTDCFYRSGTIYRHYSKLYDRHGGTEGSGASLGGDYQTGTYGDGTYHWGSALDRLG